MITKKVDVSDRLIYEQIETVKKFPLMLSWTFSRHKTQGVSLHAAVISFDLENNDRCM